MSASSPAQSGRSAAIARRKAQSAGKAALPPAHERSRGDSSAPVLRQHEAPASISSAPKPTPAPPKPTPASSTGASLPAAVASASASMAGRLMSMLRRRQQSAGKQGSVASAEPVAAPASPPPASVPATNCGTGSCREQARARRAEMSRNGRGQAAPTRPSRPPREGELNYAPKVETSPTQGGGQVTGLRIGRGRQMTGDESGASLPVTGTQYIAADGGAAVRAGGPKVGHARTVGGGVVSGTLVRSKVHVTGDEAGASVQITGEADQRPADDLTARASDGAYVSAQFQRQANPHGQTVFGSNLGRSARSVGSRERQRESAIEVTDSGLAITGSALGRSQRVTGDESGACRQLTGNQYLSPARRQAECGGQGGGSAPAAQIGAARRDPVSGAKVRESQTWSGQRVTGVDVEHRRPVTGDEPGSCATITGTPYQGPDTLHGWCDPSAGEQAEERLPARRAKAGVTGDTPVQGSQFTGTERGAARELTGTPYYRAEPAPAPAPADPVAALNQRFSVASPQRAAQLRADRSAVQAPSAAGRVSGSFAIGQDKLTGNVEFLFKPRMATGDGTKRPRISGEGRTEGPAITGGAWNEQTNVSGTEGYIAAERNPSERAGKPQAFAGAGHFKALAKVEEPKRLVSGMMGGGMQSAARVTLSGGAQA